MKSKDKLWLSYNEFDKNYHLRITRKEFEMNISMTESELVLIPKVKTATWNEHQSLKIGNCAGVPVFWSCEKNELSILVGEDAECWQFGTILSESVLGDIIDEIRGETNLL
ncbi:MAG: hypothetical protein MUC29_04995 [Pyrinomonadaceae bacterium]|jgi:hypothetical protein|nr:hypothetical protein [Pyrinomonadaceae bacterium]